VVEAAEVVRLATQPTTTTTIILEEAALWIRDPDGSEFYVEWLYLDATLFEKEESERYRTTEKIFSFKQSHFAFAMSRIQNFSKKYIIIPK